MTDLSNRAATLFDLAKQYRASQVRSANENDIRADIRENVEKLGLDSKAFQDSIRMELELTEGDRLDYVNGLQDMQEVLRDRATDLFGEEEMRKKQERIRKRQEKAAKDAGAPPASATDDNPRSDPKSGGAGGVDGAAPAKDAAAPKKRGRPSNADKAAAAAAAALEPPATLKDAVKQSDQAIKDSAAAIAEEEQRQGGALLDGAVDKMKAGGDGEPVDNGENGEPLSQSAKAAQIRDANGLN